MSVKFSVKVRSYYAIIALRYRYINYISVARYRSITAFQVKMILTFMRPRSAVTLNASAVQQLMQHSKGFAQRRTQQYAHDFPSSLVSFFYSTVGRKTTKHIFILDSLHYRMSNFTQVCVCVC